MELVLYFKSERALNQLRKGIVYTLREDRRVRTEGKDWVKTSRRGKKIAEVKVREIGLVDLSAIAEGRSTKALVMSDGKCIGLLDHFVEKSGFSSVEEWVKEYWEIIGWKANWAWLYEVKLIEWVGEDKIIDWIS